MRITLFFAVVFGLFFGFYSASCSADSLLLKRRNQTTETIKEICVDLDNKQMVFSGPLSCCSNPICQLAATLPLIAPWPAEPLGVCEHLLEELSENRPFMLDCISGDILLYGKNGINLIISASGRVREAYEMGGEDLLGVGFMKKKDLCSFEKCYLSCDLVLRRRAIRARQLKWCSTELGCEREYSEPYLTGVEDYRRRLYEVERCWELFEKRVGERA